MSNPLELPEDIIEQEVGAICGRYRIEPEMARRFLEQGFYRRPDLLGKILKRYPDEDITRLRDYKAVIKDVRKKIYYHLRQYQSDREKSRELREKLEQQISASADIKHIRQITDELLLTHISTKERADHYPVFYEKLSELIARPRTILDIGCGIHPLSYPFEKEKGPDIYVATDRDPDVIDILTTFAPCIKPARLIPLCADIAGIKAADYLTDYAPFDIAFMLKLVPVLHRQHKEVLPLLAEVPARRILLTASAESMTRKEIIMRREDKILHRFMKMTGRDVMGSFRVGNEFGYLLQ
ncbi:hypothetical protein QUF80_03065 [Desulfococcaceae bacterium HSG8]|nr:hypothetical protein [Desulfococcaceae bacterium HSG8]